MDQTVVEVAAVVSPLLATGANSALSTLAERGGEVLAGFAEPLLAAIASRLSNGSGHEEVAQALDGAVSTGELTMGQLQQFLSAARAIDNSSHTIIHGGQFNQRSAFNGPVNVSGDFHA